MAITSDEVESAQRLRVLVVDDDSALRRTLLRVLKAWFDVVLAESIADALEKIEASPFDVVVSDDKMSDGLGRTLLTTIRDRFPGTRRVLISGQDVPSERDLDPAWESFVQKPFDPRTLVALLEQLTHSKTSEHATWPKQCSCCGAAWTHEAWNDLPSIGIMPSADGESLELRLCLCRSTLSIPVA